MFPERKKVLLGTRVAELPCQEDIDCLKEEFKPFALIHAVMPKRMDIITVQGLAGRWLIEDSAHWHSLPNRFICRVSAFRNVPENLSQIGNILIAFEGRALRKNTELNNCDYQTMHDLVKIVGQAQKVTTYVEVPEIDPSLVLKE